MQVERISPGGGETNEASRARGNGFTVLRACSACAGDYEDPDRTAWTPDPPASISAQLRHLRKPEFGGYAVEKRPRALGKVLRGEDFGTVWEYQLRRETRREFVGARLRGGRKQLSAQRTAC